MKNKILIIEPNCKLDRNIVDAHLSKRYNKYNKYIKIGILNDSVVLVKKKFICKKIDKLISCNDENIKTFIILYEYFNGHKRYFSTIEQIAIYSFKNEPINTISYDLKKICDEIDIPQCDIFYIDMYDEIIDIINAKYLNEGDKK